MKSYPDCFWYLVPVTCDNPFYSPDGPTVGRLGNLTKWRPAASDLIIVSLVVVIVHFSTVLIILAVFDTVIYIL